MDSTLKQKLIDVAQYNYQYELDAHEFTIVSEDDDWKIEGSYHSKSCVIYHFGKYYKVRKAGYEQLEDVKCHYKPLVGEVVRKEITTVEWVNV